MRSSAKSSSKEDLVKLFKKVTLEEIREESSEMDPEPNQMANPNQVLSTDVIAELIAVNSRDLENQITSLQNRLTLLTTTNTVESYVVEQINDTVQCNETLDIIKSVPEFSGKMNSYVSWREAPNFAMSLYVSGSSGALTILRNKIIEDANDVLTSHGTVLYFGAILSRLDFAYSVKRPIHVIEQELSVLRQGSLSILDYCNSVDQKLTLLINKTMMTYGTNTTVTKELNKKNRNNALRVFITGLNQPLSNILFSLPSKPNVYEVIVNNDVRK